MTNSRTMGDEVHYTPLLQSRLRMEPKPGSSRSSARSRRRPGSTQRGTARGEVSIPPFPRDLPISEKRELIAAAIREHQVVIVCGETGSGKTTQLPKICLALGRGRRGLIGHTQPRRIAARSVAARIAEELHSPLGKHVGYKIRFTDTLGPQASVKIMTDGILLTETRSDPLLRAYDTIIIDEAHERSLNVDFLLGYLKRILPKRRDLKVIITSATIDPQKFSQHFGGARHAPIIEVSGRVFPVEVRYRPLVSDDPDAEDRDLRQGVLDAVDEALALEGEGDILVFLSGEREIHDISKALNKHDERSVEVLPLYARLTTEEQNRVFAPQHRRRIVLATNVAETSITVPRIRYVIDAGRARMSRYSARSGVQRLPIESISQASADQRKGRCGRLGPGVCFRLYSEDEFEARERFTPPEIVRTNLASVILQMKALRLGRVEEFPFVEAPRWSMITDGYSTLHELGAIDEWGEITKLGEQLAHLPIDPRLGRMILAARDFDRVNDALIVAAALSIQDPRHRPHDRQEAADEAHVQFRDERSDFVTLLNIWKWYQEQSRTLTQSRLRRLCRDTFLSYARMQEWVDVHHQLRALIAEAEVAGHHKCTRNPHRSKDDYEPLHRAILCGFVSHIGVKGDGHEYTGAHGRKFHIFPGSGLFKQAPQWIVAAELMETTKTYAMSVAGISAKWIEEAAPHLVKKRHSEPHWRERSADVGAFETVTLYGLEIVRNRRVAYGPLDPRAARDIFVQSALVEQRYRSNAPFVTHNRKLIDEVRRIEEKTRRRGILVDDAQLFAFYDSRVPSDIYSGKQFEAWRKKAESSDPHLLFMSRESLLSGADHTAPVEQFPDHLIINGTRLPITYRFEPGHEDDGVTVTVPRAMVHQISPQSLDWLVRGLLHEKVTHLLKSLPKSLRRNFVPATEFAAACVQRINFGEGSLPSALSDALHRMTGVSVPTDVWTLDDVPPYLRLNIRVVGDDGKTQATDRDLNALRTLLARTPAWPASAQTATKSPHLPSGRFTRWQFGDLPESVTVNRGGISVPAYPAIVDEGDAVSLQLLDTAAHAQRESQRGVLRLIRLQFSAEMRELRQQLTDVDSMAIHFAALGLGGKKDLEEELLDAAIARAFLSKGTPRTKSTFDEIISHGWHNIAGALNEVATIAGKTLETAVTVQHMLADLNAPQLEAARKELADHLNHLIYKGFMRETPLSWLAHLPRYLEGTRLRIVKITSGKLSRDRQLAAQFNSLWRRYIERMRECQRIPDAGIEEHRWMLEELRVALFAQELGTAVRVSPQRIDAHWSAIAAPR